MNGNKNIDFASSTAMEIRPGSHSQVVAVENEAVFTFESGLPAFDDAREFVFVFDAKIKPFLYMRCINREGLNFVCVDPFVIKPGFNVKLPEACAEELGLKDAEDCLILAVVTVQPDMTKTTANLIGPIVINLRTRKGMQVVLEDIDIGLVRYNVWNGIEEIARQEQVSSQSAM